jgi:hypothetical protein
LPALVAFLRNDASQSPYPGRQTFLITAQAVSLFRHSLPALVAFLRNDAAQSTYPGRQTFLIAAQAASIQPEPYTTSRLRFCENGIKHSKKT